MEVTNGGTPRLPTATGFAAETGGRRASKLTISTRRPCWSVSVCPNRLFNTDQIRVSAAAQARLLESAAEALHDPALGLHLAEEVNPREMGLLFYVASAGKDLGEAIALFARYCRIVNEAIRVQLTRRGQ